VRTVAAPLLCVLLFLLPYALMPRLALAAGACEYVMAEGVLAKLEDGDGFGFRCSADLPEVIPPSPLSSPPPSPPLADELTPRRLSLAAGVGGGGVFGCRCSRYSADTPNLPKAIPPIPPPSPPPSPPLVTGRRRAKLAEIDGV